MEAETPASQRAQDLAQRLGHRLHLEREKAVEQLRADLGEGDDSATAAKLQELLPAALSGLIDSDVWEQRLGGFRGTLVLLEHSPPKEFQIRVITQCIVHLEDSEVRVRQAVGVCLGSLASLRGTALYEDVSERLLDSINRNFDRNQDDQASDDRDASSSDTGAGSDSEGFMGQLMQNVYKVDVPGKGQMRHMTEGWKCLETSYRALQKVYVREEGEGRAKGVFHRRRSLLDLGQQTSPLPPLP